MATFRKTQNGTWQAQVRRRGWPAVTKTFRLKRDAQDWAAGVEHDMRRGSFVRRDPAERMTLSQALDRYLDNVTPTKKPSSQVGDWAKARKLRVALGNYSLAAITPDIVARYRDSQLAEGKSRDTARLQLALLGHLFEVAIREWRIGLIANPVRAVKPPRPGAARDRRLSPDEERRLLAAVDRQSNPVLGHMVRFALETAMRASELRGLRTGDVDLDRRIARLRDTKNNDSRTVPLTRAAVRTLRAALDHPSRPEGCDLYFFGEPGRDGQRRGFEYGPAWRLIKQEAGIENLRFHDLRHEAVSRLVESGLGDQEVAAISGHKSMQMLARYTHLRGEDLVDRLDRVGL